MLTRLLPRSISIPSTTQVAFISADVNYKPIRRVEKPDGFLRHSNPLSREVLRRGWKSAKGRSVDIVRADERDRDFAGQFFGEEFSTWNNCCRHSKMTFEEFESMAAPGTDVTIAKGDLFMAFDGDKLIGTLYNSNHTEKDFEQMWHGEMPGNPNPVFRVKDDYADVIASYPYARTMNQFMGLLDILQPQTGKFLPANIKKFGITEALTIHPALHKEGVGYALIEVGDEVFKKRGVSHIGVYALAYGAQQICARLGYKTVQDLPYANFKENGKPVYENMYDGATSAKCMVKVLKN
uniref:N-acetyltransferase domain-containing protein n=1 Tax=Panagrellus redivivus TaxID=6233 RepID=A0A7E4VRX7_PANRE